MVVDVIAPQDHDKHASWALAGVHGQSPSTLFHEQLDHRQVVNKQRNNPGPSLLIMVALKD
jgi:hypothetical protein